MHYWNKDNFEGLLDLANEIEKISSDMEPLGRYCRNRECGLRKEAFGALQEFIEKTKSWDDERAREYCQKILELQAQVPRVHQFLSQPLVQKYIDPVLEQWLNDQPDNPQALRWIGLLDGRTELLFKALAIVPEDMPVRSRLVTIHIDEADYATHHLDENQFIGDLDETRAALNTARSLLEDAPGNFPKQQLEEELTELESMVLDWCTYQEDPEGTFPEWCAARSRSYAWPAISAQHWLRQNTP